MTVTLRLKAYIQPFERTLALTELQALAGVEPRPVVQSEDGCTYTVSRGVAKTLSARLAYWESVGARSIVPLRQVLLEATTNVARNGVSFDEIRTHVPFDDDAPLPNRRVLRYGVHGIHEYRGKFFPQLVRSLLNASHLPKSALVVDPMCGSGTTLVEAVDAGFRAHGSDMNPLSVLMARTKVSLLSIDPERLRRCYQSLRTQLLADERGSSASLPYLGTFSTRDQDYLRRWFAIEVLESLDRIASTISLLPDRDGPIASLFWLSLSNVLRRVSWQKEDDLRVRREVRTDVEIDAVRDFLEEVGRSVRTVYAFLRQRGRVGIGAGDVAHLDARTLFPSWDHLASRVSVVITSPPYATALPYLDTDRLSLIYLKLLPREEHRSRDYTMIGNREITEKMRREYLADLERRRPDLPSSVVRLIRRIESLNHKTSAGFRRQNVPALLAKYFLDMRSTITNIAKLLSPRGYAYLVVGSNSTVAGGQHVSIDTAALLGEIGESSGLTLERSVSMEMLASRDIFRQNASNAETILFFRRR